MDAWDAWDTLATFDDDTSPLRYPVFWWRHGDRRQKTPGFFYARAEDHDDAGDPWKPVAIYDGEDGLKTERLGIAVIAVRTTPFRTVKTPDGGFERKYEKEWSQGCSIHTEILCLADGLSGLQVLSLKGLAGKAWTARGGILDRARAVVRAVEVDGRRPPVSALWLEITSERGRSGLIYRDTGYGSFVTLPALAWEEDDPKAIWRAYRVPDEAVMFVAQMSDDIRRWKEYSRAAAAAPPPRVRADSDEDIPF